MLTLMEQYIIDEAKWKFQDLYKANKERGNEWEKSSRSKSFGKTVGNALTGIVSGKSDKDVLNKLNKDKKAGERRAKISKAVGAHIGQVGGVAVASGLAGGAYLAYKLYKKWKNKEKEADTPEEKELFRKKAAAAKSKSQKLKAKKG